MLQFWSICTLCAILAAVQCQNYDYEDHSSYEDDRPDYTKYFKEPSGPAASFLVPQLQQQQQGAKDSPNGFVNPLEFQQGFPPFGFASQQIANTQPAFNPSILAASQQVFNSAPLQIFRHPGPKPDASTQKNHSYPPKLTFKPSEAEDLEPFAPPSKYEEDDDDRKEKAVLKKPNHYYPVPSKTQVQPKYSQEHKVQSLTPYEKYSFQPVGNLKSASFERIQTAPYNPSSPYKVVTASYKVAPTENHAQLCRKVSKHVSKEALENGRFKRSPEPMDCYVCTDPKSGGTFEKCSYTDEPEDGTYFRGHSEKYSTRSKRAAKGYRSKPKEFESDFYKAPDFSSYEKEAYKFPEEYYGASSDEKSYSEIQSEQLKKDGDNCKKVVKDSLTCMVCSNKKTGGNYEQCSYSSEPQAKSYAYVKEKKYNSNDEPEEEEVEQSEVKPKKLEKSKKTRPESSHYYKKSSSKNEKPYEIPYHFEESTKNQKAIPAHLHNERYGSYENPKSEESKSEKQEEDYIHKLFPEYARESRNRESKTRPGYELKSSLPEYFTAEESKKDVDSVLAEFAKKDRSNCKKVSRDKMTCFLCKDEKGVQHEECMFVSESEPKKSHIAYHEVKEFSSDPNKEAVESSRNVPVKARPAPSPSTAVPVTTKHSRVARRKTNIRIPTTAATITTSVRHVPSESRRSETRVKAREDSNGESAFASELKPRYSKKLGVTLPAYMLDISPQERDFDETLKSGR